PGLGTSVKQRTHEQVPKEAFHSSNTRGPGSLCFQARWKPIWGYTSGWAAIQRYLLKSTGIGTQRRPGTRRCRLQLGVIVGSRLIGTYSFQALQMLLARYLKCSQSLQRSGCLANASRRFLKSFGYLEGT